MTPDDIVTMLGDEEYLGMPFEKRQQVLEKSLGAASAHLSQQENWGQEEYRAFGDFAKRVRGKVTEGESAGEVAKRYGGVALTTLKDSAAVVGTAALDLGVANPDMSPKAPLENVVTALGVNVGKLVDSAFTGTRQALSGTDEALEAKLKAFRTELDAGNFPFETAGFQQWLAKQDEEMQPVRLRYFANQRGAAEAPSEEVDYAQQTGLGEKQNKALVAAYMRTRSDAAWDALQDNLLKTRTRAQLEYQEGKVTGGKLGVLMDDAFGEGASKYLMEAGDPFEVAGMVFAPLKGAKALKVVGKGRKALELGKGALAEVLSEQGSLFMDDPNASGEERLQVAKDTLAGSAGLLGLGAGVQAVVNRFKTPTGEEASVPLAEEDTETGRRGDAEAGQSVLAQLAAREVAKRGTGDGVVPAQNATGDVVLDPEQGVAASAALPEDLVSPVTVTPVSAAAPLSAGVEDGGFDNTAFSEGSAAEVVAASDVVDETLQAPSSVPHGSATALAPDNLGDGAAQAGGLAQEAAGAVAGAPEQRAARRSALSAWADETIQQSQGRLDLGADPVLFTAYAVKGADLVAQGVKDFAAWSVEMLKQFGEGIREYLEGVWQAAVKTSQVGAVDVGGGGPLNRKEGEVGGAGGNQQQPGVPLAPGETKPKAGDAVKPRSFGDLVSNDERVSEPVRDGFPNDYVPIPNLQTLGEANTVIDTLGVDGAATAVLDGGRAMPDHVRVTLGMQTMMRLDQEAKSAAQAGDGARAAALYDRAYQVGAFVDAMGTNAGRAVQAFSMWARMTPEGVLSAFEKRVRERNNGTMPKLPPELLDKLGPLKEQINKAPEGSFIRQDLMRQLMAELARWEGVKVTDILSAYWYANLLSGLNTHAINIFGNGLHILLRGLSLGVIDPTSLGQFLKGLGQGSKRGALEFGAAIKGEQVVKGENKFTQPQALELLYTEDPKTFREKAGNVLSLLKYVFRALGAEDAFFYHSAKEARAHVAAMRVAKQKFKAEGGDIGAHLAEALASGPSRWNAALGQAAQELSDAGRPVTSTQQNRRAWEIVEAQRPAEVTREAQRFGELATFTGDPQGMMGWIAKGVNTMLQGAVLPTRWGDVRVLQPVVPFVNIVANVTSSALDFTPVGLLRAAKGGHLVGRDNEVWERSERAERVGSAVLGMAATGIVAAVANAFKDDEDPPFMITAMGPEDKAKRQQLMAAGWMPYSIKIGDAYFRYNETPLVIPFSMVGGWMDKHRYKEKWEQESLGARMGYVASLFPKAWTDSGFLSSVGQVMDVMRGDRPASDLLTRSASGFIPGQGMLRDISRITDPEKVDDTSLRAAFFKDVPFVKRIGTRAALNVFGEPVKLEGVQRLPVVSRVMGEESQDKEAVWLAQNKLWVPGLDYTDLSVNLTSPTKAEKYGLQAIRAERAAKLGRQYAEVFTDAEGYRYAQRAGQLTRQAVKQLRTQHEAGQLQKDQLQDRLESAVRAARKVSKREMMFGG